MYAAVRLVLVYCIETCTVHVQNYGIVCHNTYMCMYMDMDTVHILYIYSIYMYMCTLSCVAGKV